MKKMKYILTTGVLATLVFSCRPEYPEPQVNKSSVAPLARTNANNARIMVFNALVDLSPEENNPQSRFQIAVDGTPLTNFDGTPAVVFSNQFRLDGATVIPLMRKFPSAVSTPIGISGALEQSSQYIPVAANPGFNAASTAFTNFGQAVPASILNNIEISPAQQERGIFIPGGRRDISFLDADGVNVGSLRVSTNLNAGSLTTVFLRGRLGTTSGADAQGATTVTETIPTPTGAAIRFLNFASDQTEVQLLTADASAPSPFNISRRPMIVFPNAPTNTRYSLDQQLPLKLDSLRATRDSLSSRRRYNALTATISASSARQISVERTSDGTGIPNYTQALNFGNYTNIPAGTFTFNFYGINRRHLAAIVAKNLSFNFLAGGVYTIVLHGSAQEGYKCDIIRMN